MFLSCTWAKLPKSVSTQRVFKYHPPRPHRANHLNVGGSNFASQKFIPSIWHFSSMKRVTSIILSVSYSLNFVDQLQIVPELWNAFFFLHWYLHYKLCRELFRTGNWVEEKPTFYNARKQAGWIPWYQGIPWYYHDRGRASIQCLVREEQSVHRALWLWTLC